MMTKMLMVFYMVSLWKCWAKTLSWGSPQEPLFSCLPRDKPRPRIIINNSPAAVENIFLWLCKLSCMEKHEAIIPESSGSSTYLSLRFHTHTHIHITYEFSLRPRFPLSLSPTFPSPRITKDSGGCFWRLFSLSSGGESLPNNDFLPRGGV